VASKEPRLCTSALVHDLYRCRSSSERELASRNPHGSTVISRSSGLRAYSSSRECELFTARTELLTPRRTPPSGELSASIRSDDEGEVS
jgi:hypothetical protein